MAVSTCAALLSYLRSTIIHETAMQFQALIPLCTLHNYHSHISTYNLSCAAEKFLASPCNFRLRVLQYTSWFLPQRWAAACVCESTHVPQEGFSLLKKSAKSSAVRPHPSNSCDPTAPLNACFHQASAPRVRIGFCVPLERVAPDNANPFRCFIMAHRRHEHITRRQAARKPASAKPVRPKIWRCI